MHRKSYSSQIKEDEWKAGRELYRAHNCPSCHFGTDRETLFGAYNRANSDLEVGDQISRIKDILQDRNHKSKGVAADTLKSQDLKKLLTFLKAPNSNELVN